MQIAQRYIRTIVNNPETRNVFFFLLLNISFTGVEFLYGWICNSLGLTADAIHMLFDSTALICSLTASVVAKREANTRYTYGYRRVETLVGFVNALALVFASGNIVWEAIGRLMIPQKLNQDNLMLVSVLGLLVNIVGIFAFDHGGMHSHHGHDHSGHSHGHESHDHSGHSHGHNHSSNCKGHENAGMSDVFSNPLLHGMFLHILADALGSVGVIISSLLIQWFGKLFLSRLGMG